MATLQHEAIPSSRAKVFLVPPDGSSPIPLALVEDFVASKVIRSENFESLGEPVPPDNVSNNEQGRVRWSKVHQLDSATLAVITPRIARWVAYEAFSILVLDPETNEPIALAVDVRANAFDLSMRAGQAVRANFDGLCRYVLLGDEVKSG